MRPGQQNKRGRGRNNNNNNRKGGNPLSRTYDSSGPDVKIRGTAQHIAEKYANLARDAQSSGDNVMAENYFQHAEHYTRIIAAAQAQIQERHQRDDRDNADRDGSNERDDNERTASDRSERSEHSGNGRDYGNGHDRTAEHRGGEAQHGVSGSGPQPVIDGVPAEVAMGESAESAGAGARRRGAASRPRRPRRNDAAAAGEPGSGDSGDAEKPARRSRAAKTEPESGDSDSESFAEASSE